MAVVGEEGGRCEGLEDDRWGCCGENDFRLGSDLVVEDQEEEGEEDEVYGRCDGLAGRGQRG